VSHIDCIKLAITYDHAVYNTIFMDIVSNCHPTWTHADSEPASLLNAAYLREKQNKTIL
jgi:ribosomal protein L31